MENALNIVLSCDHKYVVPSAVVIQSIINHNTDMSLKFYLFTHEYDKWSKKEKKIIEDFSEKGYPVQLISDQKIVDICEKNNIAKYKNGFGIYTKLFMADYIDNENNILWLDSDIVVTGSLKELSTLDTYACYGCYDYLNSERRKRILQMDSSSAFGMFGMFVINPKIWKEKEAERRIIEWFSLYENEHMEEVIKAVGVDQGIISVALEKMWGILDAKYMVIPGIYIVGYENTRKMWRLSDFYSKDSVENARKNPIIIHYMHYMVQKPWFHDELNEFENEWVDCYKTIEGATEIFALKDREFSKDEKVKRWLFFHMNSLFLLLGRIHVINWENQTKKTMKKYYIGK